VKISNSQIADFQKCERRFYYAHMLDLRARDYPEPLKRGIDGHALFEVALKFRMENPEAPYENCVSSLNALIEEYVTEGNQLGLSVYRHVIAFIARVYEEEWEVVSVERNVLSETPYDDIEFAWTADVVFRWTKGPKRGRLFMLDWKFTAQQWNDVQVAMHQQLFKYMSYWNQENPEDKIGHVGIVNLLTRAAQGEVASKLFAIKWQTVNKDKIARIDFENDILIQRVAVAKSTWAPEQFVRTNDSYACKMCMFANDICPAELEGRSIEKYLQVNYVKNTYFSDNYGD